MVVRFYGKIVNNYGNRAANVIEVTKRFVGFIFFFFEISSERTKRGYSEYYVSYTSLSLPFIHIPRCRDLEIIIQYNSV